MLPVISAGVASAARPADAAGLREDKRAQPRLLLHIACQAGGQILAGLPTHYLCGAPVRFLLRAIAPGDGPDGPGVCPICAALDHPVAVGMIRAVEPASSHKEEAMARRHTYEVPLAWTGNRGSGTSSYRDYDRDHQVAAEGRPPIQASSEPLFRGNPARWNPELGLTAALSQCHMLRYLHLCAVSGVVVTSYADDAQGAMEETEDGGGQFTEVVLRPRVTVSSPEMVDAAMRLHEEAHAKCFIARSVSFPVRHEPVVAGPPTFDGVARLTSLQVQVADLSAAAKSYGPFIGLELSDEPHRHDGNEALHYDLAWGDFASGDYMMLHLAQAEPGRHTTGAQIGITVEDVDAVHQRAAQFGVTVLEPPHDGQWGRCATYEDPDRNSISVTAAWPAPAAGQVTATA